ncbi:MAG: hypothetical protein K2N03_05710 [Muribaculaceae bacterium]|nr:hypothetical protein [Muribaculaceae bacterium]
MVISFMTIPEYAFSQSPVFEDIENMSYDEFVKNSKSEYLSFRDRVNKEYADFMRLYPWISIKKENPHPAPVIIEPEPDVIPEEEESIIETPSPVIIEDVIKIQQPEPQPLPIEEISEPEEREVISYLDILFYGTKIKIRDPRLSEWRLTGTTENDFANGFDFLSKNSTNSLIIDCLNIRDSLSLPDWGYIKLLDKISSELKGTDTNEKSLLLGFLLNQSGYKVRYGLDFKGSLFILISTRGILYDHHRYFLDNEWYYSYTNPDGRDVKICNFNMPGEQSFDMGIRCSPNFDYSPGNKREITVKRHPEVSLSLTPNQNLIDFFNDYPEATLDDSPYSMWAIHGNTPVSKEIKEQIYPVLRDHIKEKSELESLQFLLKVAQSFPYGFDENIWGKDRAFWMEESWHYPYSDCEDHAIQFSHLVRDLLNLDVCLVYYPGHLSSCVALSNNETHGDFIRYEDKNYTVCDPTYFYSGVGKTAPSNKNSEAILIPLLR